MNSPSNLLDDALGLVVNPLPNRVILIEDCVETSGAFILHHLIKRSLANGGDVIFVAFSQPFSHYDRIMRKMGYNLSMQRENKRLKFLDMMKLECPTEHKANFAEVMDCYRCSSTHGDQYGVLQQCLKDILSVIKPSPNDEGMRVRALRELETVVRSTESLKNVVEVRPYGSYISHLYTKWGDLDASVELTHHSSSSIDRRRKIEVLQDIKSELQRKGVGRNFNFIPTARVPVLRYESERQNVSCDVSIDNQLGWMKSRVLFLISKIDEQFRDLVLLIKEWARAHHINDPKSGTLNSYSLCLLVIFHFQTCEPAILPPLKDIYGRDFDDLTGNYWRTLERKIVDGCADNIAKFKSSRQRKGNNLAQLLITFFRKFSELERLSSDFAICTYTGRLERIRSNFGWMEKSHNLLIEDPFDRPDNASRAVGSQELLMISEAFKKTSRKLSKSSILSSRNALLANLVSPNIRSLLEDGGSQRGNCRTAPVEFIGHITHKAGSQSGNCKTAPVEFIGHITHKA